MTIHEMTAALNDRTDENGGRLHFTGDYAGMFDISTEQAERIAAKADSAADFIRIWESDGWWA